MPMTRQERVALHKKQGRIQVGSGPPRMEDLTEGVPVLRSTTEGLVEYVKYNKEIYKKLLDKG